MEPLPMSGRPTTVLRATRAFVAAVALGAPAVLVTASPASAETTLEVEAGYDGMYLPGRPVPVRVVVTADRLVRGTLEVVVGGGFGAGVTTTTVPVEVPGGSVKELVVVIPTPIVGGGEVRATLAADDERVVETASLSFRGEREIVGLLAGIAPARPPAGVPLVGDLGTADLFVLDEELLAGAPASLASVGTVVAGPGDLAALPEPTRRALLTWVEAGGHLVVDLPIGSRVDGIPDEWQPAEVGRITAGLGEVRLSDGAAAAGRWADLLEPTPHISGEEAMNLSQGGFGGEPVGDTVARDTGLELARLGWLLGYLAVYVAIAGPIAFMVLRRLRRTNLVWVAVPVVAVLFVGVSWFAGSDLRRGTQAAHGSVVVSGPGGSSATSHVGVVSRNGGDGRVTFPAGWTAGTLDTGFFGGVSNGAAVVPTAQGVEGRVGLDAGQFGVVSGSGVVEFEGGLVVEATSSENRIAKGTVRNTTDVTLQRVGVFVGRGGVHVGNLAPGEEKDWVLDPGPVQADPFRPVEADVWPAESGYTSEFRVDSVVALALLAHTGFSAASAGHPAGIAVAVGWTREYHPPLTATGGGDTLTGRAAVVGRSRVRPEGGALTDMTVVREILRGPQGTRGVEVDRNMGEQPAVFRFVLPPGSVGDVHLDVPAYVSHVDVWTPGGWVEVDDARDLGFDGGDPLRVHEVDLPGAAVRDGVVYARVALRLDFGSFDGDRLMVGPGVAT